MKTYLPYHMRKIGISLFILGASITFTGEIDDFMAGFTAGFNETTLGESISYEEGLKIWEKQNNGLIFSEAERSQWGLVGFILSLSGLLIYIFSKEKIEDEFISHIRGKSMIKSVAITWTLFLLLKFFNWDETISALEIMQLQILVYILIYTYTKKIKFAQ